MRHRLLPLACASPPTTSLASVDLNTLGVFRIENGHAVVGLSNDPVKNQLREYSVGLKKQCPRDISPGDPSQLESASQRL